ncbi:hypothetical protein M231_06198 [Tremella mesenterica]|uniref:E3 ubiquitin protein ligase n=1 Tax=Tremella mesenterica TaxID=5217 RepID=A0A4Q1BCH9_TREME|nr:hypothetical protein M231_06198 [Tremella mesenterica]
MNADLKRVRETGIDESLPGAKRRALSMSLPPTSEPDEDRLEDWQKVVESHRKEAIFRQMLAYKRSYDAEARKASELEAQRRVLEASVRAVEICWAQVVTAIQDHAGQQELGVATEDLLNPTLDSGLVTQELESALRSRLPPTQRLIARFAALASQGAVRPTAAQELHNRLLKLQAEADASRAHNQTLKSQLLSLTDTRDSLSRDLDKLQKSLDRQRMAHDKERLEWNSRDRDRGSSTPAQKAANGSGHVTPNGVEPETKPLVNGAEPTHLLVPDTLEAEEVARSRLEQLDALRSQNTALQQDLDRLRVLAEHPSEATLRQSPFFHVYLHQLATEINRANTMQMRAEITEQKLDEVRNGNQEFHQVIVAESKAEVEALRQAGSKKDSDLARLRGIRDDLTAELAEKKAKEQEKFTYGEQMEALATARQERVKSLLSECRRLKGTLAAREGAEGYLSFLRSGGVEGDYLKELEGKYKAAQEQIIALSAIVNSSPNPEELQDHVAIRLELNEAKSRLERFERILGSDSDPSTDAATLGVRLQKLEEEKKALEIRLSEAEVSANAAYSEIEVLSRSCDDLDKLVNSRVFDLKESELRIQRLTTEKAKADNKYFAAMRHKESLEAECKIAQRSVDKQAKLLERAQEVERSLNVQIAERDRGWTAAKNELYKLQSELAQSTSDRSQLELRLQQSQAAGAQLQQMLAQRVAEADAEKAEKVKVQEELGTSQRTVKKLKERQTAMSGGGGKSSPEYEALLEEKNRLWQVLRCQCCGINLKQQAIVKCMHTFCKQCLDDRIASRQRRCPTCGTGFAKEDVKDMFWK